MQGMTWFMVLARTRIRVHAGHIKPYCLFIVHVDFEMFLERWLAQIIAQARFEKLR
jgi:hypothetical protein